LNFTFLRLKSTAPKHSSHKARLLFVSLDAELVGWGWTTARVLIYGRVCHIARITRPTCFYKFHIITSAQFKHIFIFARRAESRASVCMRRADVFFSKSNPLCLHLLAVDYVRVQLN
jgi:hypothetical protein